MADDTNNNDQESILDDEEFSTALSENEIYDFISNEPVKASSTENTLQAVARSLVDEYEFDHTQLARDITARYEVIDDRGKSRSVRKKINIAVFPEGVNKDNTDEIIRICIIQTPKTKANDRKKGVYLLEEIMGALPNCSYGLWSNGTDLAFKEKITGEGRIQPEYVDLYDLPGFEETAKDLDNPKRQTGRIATGDNLVKTFSRVHDYIYGNQGLKKDAAFFQVLNLIFCKIYDERTPGKRRFWVKGTERNTPEGQRAIAQRIKTLFEEVKADKNYSSVFTERDTIELNDRVLAYVVGEFSRYNLLETDVDVKGAAYEEITASTLKAQRGQFFTPTNVIRLMVNMMDPGNDKDLTNSQNWPRILDPACGSGRFLTYALDHIRKKMATQLCTTTHPLLQVRELENHPENSSLIREYASQCLFGFDFDPDLKRAARMNMILNNDGHGNILSFNSLEYPLMLGRKSIKEIKAEYSGRASDNISDAERARIDADFGTFDYVFTNPPFGAKIPVDDPQILEQFDLGHKWNKDEDGTWVMNYETQSSVAPEVLFIERCIQWVKPGIGKVAIVLPDGILGNPDSESIRYWILKKCQILASVDLPVEAFLPQVGVQSSLIFLRRKSKEEIDAEIISGSKKYNLFMAMAEKVGHDRRGNTIYEKDEDGNEIVYSGKKTILRKRRGGQSYVLIERPSQDKSVDDDLPKIGKAYEKFISKMGWKS